MDRSANRGKFLKCYKPMTVFFALSKVIYNPVSIVEVYNRSGVQFYLIIALHARRRGYNTTILKELVFLMVVASFCYRAHVLLSTLYVHCFGSFRRRTVKEHNTDSTL